MDEGLVELTRAQGDEAKLITMSMACNSKLKSTLLLLYFVKLNLLYIRNTNLDEEISIVFVFCWPIL